jgi:putative DNA primase/helicase
MPQMSFEEVVEALGFISPDMPREDWVRIGMAIKSEYPNQEGFSLFDGWSESGATYKVADCSATWRSINAGGGITIASLFHEAKANGWKSGKPPQQVIKPSQKRPPKPKKDHKPYARQLWREAESCRDDALVASHPYAVKKGITWAAGAARGRASGGVIGQNQDCLIIPIRTLEGEFCGVECIAPYKNSDGKDKQTFGDKSGGVLVLGNDLDESLPNVIVEGWATGARMLHIFKGNVCIYVCFGGADSGLDKWYFRIKKKFPNRKVIRAREFPK